MQIFAIFQKKNHRLLFDETSITTITESDSHANTFFWIFEDINKHLACKPDKDAIVTPRVLNDEGSRASIIQSWEILYFPNENAYRFRTVDNTFLGVDAQNIVGANTGLDEKSLWILEKVGTSYRIKLKSINDNDYLKIGTGNIILSNSGGATLWNFEISSGVPPGLRITF